MTARPTTSRTREDRWVLSCGSSPCSWWERPCFLPFVRRASPRFAVRFFRSSCPWRSWRFAPSRLLLRTQRGGTGPFSDRFLLPTARPAIERKTASTASSPSRSARAEPRRSPLTATSWSSANTGSGRRAPAPLVSALRLHHHRGLRGGSERRSAPPASRHPGHRRRRSPPPALRHQSRRSGGALRLGGSFGQSQACASGHRRELDGRRSAAGGLGLRSSALHAPASSRERAASRPPIYRRTAGTFPRTDARTGSPPGPSGGC